MQLQNKHAFISLHVHNTMQSPSKITVYVNRHKANLWNKKPPNIWYSTNMFLYVKSVVVEKGWAVRLPAGGGAGGRVGGGEGAAAAQSTRILHLWRHTAPPRLNRIVNI
jgi:hypothetical protein